MASFYFNLNEIFSWGWKFFLTLVYLSVKSNIAFYSVAWCPNTSLSVIAVAFDKQVVLLNTGLGDKLIVDQTDVRCLLLLLLFFF